MLYVRVHTYNIYITGCPDRRPELIMNIYDDIFDHEP